MKISLVVPVYNEELAIPEFIKEVKEKLSNYDKEIVFVNDGSKDNTGILLSDLAYKDDSIVFIRRCSNTYRC